MMVRGRQRRIAAGLAAALTGAAILAAGSWVMAGDDSKLETDQTVKSAVTAAPEAEAAIAPNAAATALSLGDSAPLTHVKMKNVDGKQVSLADVKGASGTLVVFTCNACPWARAWHDRIVRLGNTYSKKGVGVIAVNSNDPGRVADDGYAPMQARAKQTGMSFPYVVDATSDMARAFGASRTPEAFLFDRKGQLVYHGTIDDNAQKPDEVRARYLEDALDAVVAGRSVALAETKALGCGIKFRNRSSGAKRT